MARKENEEMVERIMEEIMDKITEHHGDGDEEHHHPDLHGPDKAELPGWDNSLHKRGGRITKPTMGVAPPTMLASLLIMRRGV